MTTPVTTWRSFPALVAAHKTLADAGSALPGLVEAARQADVNLTTARTKDERADIDALTGKGTNKDREKAANALKENRIAAAQANDALELCRATIDKMRVMIPALEVEAKATVWAEQKSAYLASVAAVAEAGARLAALQSDLRVMRDSLEMEHWFTPGDDSLIIRDAEGCAIGRLADGPSGRVKLPDGCASMLGLGLAFRDVTADRVETFKIHARQHGAKV